jgi:predicted RNA-binding Zn-ribbon protein involved in translation (DUF1610 family)
MIVRCGRCKAELEVGGAGEFLCPRCGTRNVVRGAPAQSPYDIPDLTIPGRQPVPTTPSVDDGSVRWIVCPECAWRFPAGTDAIDVICPNCRTSLALDESGARAASEP